MAFAGCVWTSRWRMLPLRRLVSSGINPHRCLRVPSNCPIHRLVSPGISPHQCLRVPGNPPIHKLSVKSELDERFPGGRPEAASTGLGTGKIAGGHRWADCGGGLTLLADARVWRAAGSPQTFTTNQKVLLCTKNIHTSPRRLVLPPHVWLLIKPLQKLLAIILGRSVRKWWRALPANKRRLFKESAWRHRWKVSLSAAGLGFFFILFYFTNLEEAPVTGRARLLVFRKEHYDLLTALEYETLIEEFKDEMLPEKDQRYQLVQKIVQHLIACNSDLPEVTEIKWTLHVVDKPIMNAFVLPNGQIFVFTGMLDAVEDIHQLAFLMGHELAHAILDHTAEKASIDHFLDFLFLISLAMIWAICPMDSLALVTQWIQSKLREIIFARPFSRTLEAEADKVGLELAAKACVDVRASSVLWKRMDLLDGLLGQPRKPEWLSTHPSHENRAEHLERLIPKALELSASCGCPPLSSREDPRLLFEMTKRQLLQGSEGKTIKGPLRPGRVDDGAPAIRV